MEQKRSLFKKDCQTALNNLVRIMRIVGQARVITPIVKIANDMFAKEEAREDCRYYGLMILSQLGECFQSIDDIKEYIPIVIQAIKHENPLLRHAAVNVLGQFSSEFGSKLTEEYGEIVYNILVQMLERQKVSRVKIRILTALTNILGSLKLTTITSTYQNIIERVLEMAKSDTSIIVKQKAYFTLSGFIQAAPNNLTANLNEYFSIFFRFFRSQYYKRKKYIKLKGIGNETTGWELCGLDTGQLKLYLNEVINILAKFKKKVFNTSTLKKVQKTWKQLTTFSKQDFTLFAFKKIEQLKFTIHNIAMR